MRPILQVFTTILISFFLIFIFVTNTISVHAAIPGDANGDGLVNGQDYIIWVNHYGQAVSGPSNGDFNGNSFVDGQDYIVWTIHYGSGSSSPTPVITSTTSPSPSSQLNVVIILTDDQRWDTVEKQVDRDGDGTLDGPVMPNVVKELIGRGVTFSNAFMSNPVCCADRASILSGGYYSHNTGVLNNNYPNGGAKKFKDTPDSLPLLLQQRGYKTGGIMGKYLNEYQSLSPTPYIPPGWDKFMVPDIVTDWHNFRMVMGSSSNSASTGTRTDVYKKYITDFLKDQAVSFLDSTGTQPFFLYFAPTAPHLPATPSDIDKALFPNFKYRGRGYGEEDVTDKPAWLQYIASNYFEPNISIIDEEHRNQLRSLQAVDRAVKTLVDKINALGKLDNTVFIYVSDNGFMWGEHRIPRSKSLPYEESIRAPFTIVVPGISPRKDAHLVVTNLDIGPTIFDLTGIAKQTDGVSLIPLLQKSAVSWRSNFLIESYGTGIGITGVWAGIRTKDSIGDWKYVEYPTGEKELYNLTTDPYEFASGHNNPNYKTKMSALAQKLSTMKGLAMTVFQVNVPPGLVDSPYQFQLTAWGGTPPYRWRVIGGKLPTDLSLYPKLGLIQGSPTTAETVTATIEVKDSSISPYTNQPQSFVQDFTFAVGARSPLLAPSPTPYDPTIDVD